MSEPQPTTSDGSPFRPGVVYTRPVNDSTAGFQPIGYLAELKSTPADAEGVRLDQPTLVIDTTPFSVTIPVPGNLARKFLFWCTGLPFFYIPPHPQLPPSPERLALPWGDSAYTTWVTQMWLPGGPDPELGWCCGPPANGLTPSSEGPRREHQIPWRRIADTHGDASK